MKSSRPRGVIGCLMSRRPFVAKDELTFAVPMNKFEKMFENMDESFLITESWKRVQRRIQA
ncbi:Uncharacterised protein [uncultured archaeon]|nr:Uncharacterised protein [uncultured archaeon]